MPTRGVRRPHRAGTVGGGQQHPPEQLAGVSDQAAERNQGHDRQSEEQQESGATGQRAETARAGGERVLVLARRPGLHGAADRGRQVDPTGEQTVGPLEGVTHARQWRRQEPADRPRAHLAQWSPGSASPREGTQVDQDGHRGDLVQGLTRSLAQEQAEGAQRRADTEAKAVPRDGVPRRVGQQHVEGRAPVGAMSSAARRLRGASTARCGLRVMDDGIRDDADPVPGQVGPPPEVEVIAEHDQPRVEPVQLVPDVPADQQAGRTDREHVAPIVALALVDLAALEPGLTPASAARSQADLEQQRGFGPAPHLRTRDADRRACVDGGEQPPKRLRLRRAVVVQQPQPFDVVEVGGLARAGGR